MRFRHVWSCAPVCAPARTTLITGQYAPSLGAEHMRSEVALPAELTLFPQLLREVGYYCTNNAKEDYNVAAAGRTWGRLITPGPLAAAARGRAVLRRLQLRGQP
jgi:arylsulfatase A-like enzyme